MYAITFGAEDGEIERLRAEGMPVKAIFGLEDMPGVVSGGNMVGLLDQAPHPNAAALRGNLDFAIIDNIQRPIRTKLTVGGTLKAMMRQLGGGTRDFVHRKIHALAALHINPHDFEARRSRHARRGDRRNIPK